MRTPEDLLECGLRVIEQARTENTIWGMHPLFSGGHDSYCACYVASHHKLFQGYVCHIDTGIGSKSTRTFVDGVSTEEGWKLYVLKSPRKKDSYESIVSRFGFPSYGLHRMTYISLKERSIAGITGVRGRVIQGSKWLLISGARSSESQRRMGHVSPIQLDGNRVWVAPCHDWSSEEQRTFMDYHRLPLNPIKMSILGMSGECFCGCFARPNELEMIKEIVPDVALKIKELRVLAVENDKPCEWGKHPKGSCPTELQPTGPMCVGCDHRLAGIRVG